MSNSTIKMLIDCYENEISLISICNQEELIKLVNSHDIEVRAWIAKAFAIDSENDIAFSYLQQLAGDPDASVRVEAIDSLSEFICTESFNVLTSALYDPDYLVRSYAAFGVAYVGRIISPSAATKLLAMSKDTENNPYVLVSIYEGLYILGDISCLKKLIGLFYSNNYQIQCSVLNALKEILNRDNVMQINCFLQTITYRQLPKSVISSIEELDKQCKPYISP